MKKLITLFLALVFGFGLKAQTYDPQVTISIDQVLETEVTVTFTPNEDCASYNYLLATESEVQQWLMIMGMELPEYLHTYGFPAEETLSHTFTELEPNTEYMIYAVPVGPDGNFGEVAQETITTTPGGGTDIIPDFTGRDIEGNEINLYSILDAGQAVFINFFLYGDEFSEPPMADIVEAYHLYGCNAHDVFFMEISPNGTDANCQSWVDRFGVQYPTISRDGGGNDIAQSIPVGFYPTLMLVRPDHTIAMRDIYPPTLEYIIDAFEGEGYMQYPCLEETLTLSADTLYFTYDNYNDPQLLQVTNNTAEPEVTIYHYETMPLGQYSETDIYFIIYEGQEYGDLDELNIIVPQGETVDLYVGLLEQMKYRPYYTQITFKNTLEDVSVIASSEVTQNVDENEASIPLFPNPANDFVTVKGENLGTVCVYNALGQTVDEFEANGNETNINTAGYENGVYVVKVGEKAVRFVVRH